MLSGGWRIVCCACWLVLVSSTALAQPDDGDFWAFLPEGREVARCVDGSPAKELATQHLERLDERVAELAVSDPVDTVRAELHDLLKTDCFLFAAEAGRVPAPDTSTSLKAWMDAGGRAWLWSVLELPALGPASSRTPHIVIPPDTRQTLTLEAHRDHPLAPLLCRATDTSCGASTRGWRARADAALEDAAPHRTSPDDADGDVSPAEAARGCEAIIAGSMAADRYQPWRACLETARPVQWALPLGQFAAPSTGWVVVAGRRGHYAFCDTVRAYDLHTGAALVDDSCSDLALRPDGSVSVDDTNRARVRYTRAGVVSADNLREAVWMLLMRGEVERVQLRAEYHPLPGGVVPHLVVHPVDRRFEGAFWGHTGQTRLTWRWGPSGGAALAGAVTWPDSFDAAERHAAALLDIAEQGFVERCPPRSVPSADALLSGPVSMLNHVTAEDARDVEALVRDAVARWRRLRPCR